MYHISKAVPADAESILALQKRAYESEARLYNDWSIPPLTQTLESLLQEIRTITVLKAVESADIVGSVRASINDSVCTIGRLFVDPTRQGHGIGTSLLQAIEAAFPHSEGFELHTGSNSEGNIRLYERHGYFIEDSKRLSEQVTIVIMRKRALRTSR